MNSLPRFGSRSTAARRPVGRFALGVCALCAMGLPGQGWASGSGSDTSLHWDFQGGRTAFTDFWRPLSGHWDVATEAEHPTNQMLHQASAGPHLAVLASREPLTNFEFSLRVRTDSFAQTTRNWQVGFVFRRQDTERYYKFRITAANLALVRNTPPRAGAVPSSQGHTRTASASLVRTEGQLLVFQPLTAPKDSWHTLSVKCLGESLTVGFDGKDLQTLTDAGVGSGLLGLFSLNTPADFDDLTLLIRPTPKLTGKIAVLPGAFTPFQGKEALIYYGLDRDQPVTVQVLGPEGRLFNLLTQDIHSRGVNSVAWDGQGLTATLPRPGQYTVVVIVAGKAQRAPVRVLGSASAPGGKP